MQAHYTVRDFLPLIAMFTIILFLTWMSQGCRGWHWMSAMSDFMGFFFVIFGSLKIINIHGFVKAYAMYDILAKQSIMYAYSYPFIELALGIAYLTRFAPFATNLITLIVMLFSAAGVAIELAAQREFVCACLGALFTVPMTYVTLAEDLLMALMALIMLLY
ncbi:MAG: MauE/DoxX family redox-associated membrane protein [Candidatus Babeliales bacterium]